MTNSLLANRWPWVLAALLVIGVYMSTWIEFNPPSRAPAAAERPLGTLEDVRKFAERDDTNVLFVLIDTLRADRLGMYGYERDTSPFLDGIANEGVLFRNHLAQSSWTKCSMASLWTGLYPVRTGVTRFNHALPAEAKMPAEILRDEGFRTVGLFRNGWVMGYFGFDQGFDVYMKPTASRIPPKVRRENPTLSYQGTDLDVVSTATEFLRLHGDERFFLYLHLMDVHEYLYTEETAIFGTTNSDIYDNSILHVDYVMQTLFARLDELGVRDNTLVVIASDHGEAFGERGFEGHARQIYRETTEIPLVLSFPFRLEQGVEVLPRTANVDLWPTIFELIGVGELEGEVDGRSFVPEILAGGALESGEGAEPRPAYAFLDQTWGLNGHRPRPSIAITEGPLRMVASHSTGRRMLSLFDRSEDEAELKNLAAARPEVSRRLDALTAAHLAQKPPWQELVPELEIDEMQLNQLRALGYQLP